MSEQNAAQNAVQKTTQVVFNGKGSEYFGIWIVNLMLSLVTLGIYSAWAKVRRKKYFYNNTLIENVGFDYHANPISILKGRIIAVVLLAAYSASKSLPTISTVLLVLFYIVLPWIIVRGNIFNARNTSHRGLRFNFAGTLGQAFKIYVLIPLVVVIPVGAFSYYLSTKIMSATPVTSKLVTYFWVIPLLITLIVACAYPYMDYLRKHFLMNHYQFGLTQFDMRAAVKGFYNAHFKAYLIAFMLPVIGILAAIAIPIYHQYQLKAKAAQHSELQLPSQIATTSLMGFMPIDGNKIILAENEVVTDQPSQIAPVTPDESNLTLEERDFALENGLPLDKASVQAAMQGSEFDVKQAPVQTEVPEKTWEEKMKEEAKQTKKERENAEKKMRDKMWLDPSFWAGMLAVTLVYAFFIFGFLGYLKARVGNLIWNNTSFDELSFNSTLRARDLIWLYFSNIVAIIFTAGLATPWAQIRLARYRASKLQIVGDVDFDQFVGGKKAEMKATGEEIADFFDVDLSFG